jgi:hypothetical protein
VKCFVDHAEPLLPASLGLIVSVKLALDRHSGDLRANKWN